MRPKIKGRVRFGDISIGRGFLQVAKNLDGRIDL